MASDGINKKRRRFLTVTTGAVGGVGVAFAAVPFIKAWQPSAKAKAAGAPVEVDISKLEVGQALRVEWRGKPVFVVRRPPAAMDLLPKQDSRLKDPNSDNEDQQPTYAKNGARSLQNGDLLVLVGICTHLGCVPQLVQEMKPQFFDENWAGGFYCPCHKSRFDLAGRVYKGVPAPSNLPVPPYAFIDSNRIVIGVDPQEAA